MASGSIKGKIEEQASEFEHVESERLLHWRLVLFFAVLHKCRAKHFYMEKNAASLERHVELERTLKRKIPDVTRKYLSSSVFSHRKNEYLFSPRCSAYMHTYILFYARKHAGQHVTRIFFSFIFAGGSLEGLKSEARPPPPPPPTVYCIPFRARAAEECCRKSPRSNFIAKKGRPWGGAERIRGPATNIEL